MKNYYVGQQVYISSSQGPKMTITKIDGDDMVLVDDNSTFYYHKGDCTLVPVPDVRFEQLKLF